MTWLSNGSTASDDVNCRRQHVLCPREEGGNLATTRKSTRAIERAEILKSEWTVLVGEGLVAIGSIVVVVGLIRALKALLKDDTE